VSQPYHDSKFDPGCSYILWSLFRKGFLSRSSSRASSQKPPAISIPQVLPRPGFTLQDNLMLEEAVDQARIRWFPDLPKIKARIGGPEDVRLAQYNAWYQNAVVINPMFFEKASSKELKETIKHELVHAWVAHHYPNEFDKETNGHDEHFLKKAIEIGLDVRGTLWAYPKSKLIYERLTKRNIDVIAPTRYILVKPDPSRLSDLTGKFFSGRVAADLLPFFWGLAVLLGYSLVRFHARMNQFTVWGIWVIMLSCIVCGWGSLRSKFRRR
jgi:SprT-like family